MKEVRRPQNEIVTIQELFSSELLHKRPNVKEALRPAYVSTELNALGSYSPWTLRHSVRTGLIVDSLYTAFPVLGAGDEAIAATAVRAGFVHDVGKREVRKEVLDKPDAMSEEDFLHMQTHVTKGVAILAPHEEITADIAGAHHKFQGERSYPGRAINPEVFDITNPRFVAKLMVAVADTTDAVYTGRPYPKWGMPDPAAVKSESVVHAIVTEKFTPYLRGLSPDILDYAVTARVTLGR